LRGAVGNGNGLNEALRNRTGNHIIAPAPRAAAASSFCCSEKIEV
jgi:hypothetical protein